MSHLYLALVGRRKFFLLVIPIVLSSFTHMWNPAGFPDIIYDEGVYIKRALHLQSGLGPIESSYYDHPFFGQTFLAAFFLLIGFPDSMNALSDEGSIASLYSVPRLMLGILAVIDTFLIYKITELRYKSGTIALIASLLFAVMPITWLTRRVVLDSILLPFLLSSILFAVYATMKVNQDRKRLLWIMLSGIFLGLAIFTKVPVFAMIPVVGYLVYSSSRGAMQKPSLRSLAVWFIPVIMIPMLWPLYSITTGEFEGWLGDVSLQAQRKGWIGNLIEHFYSLDPVLFLLGAAGFAYAAIKRDYFLILWLAPYLLFLSSGVYVQDFHWIPILPVFCIAAAVLVDSLITSASKRTDYLKKTIPLSVISAIALFGFASTILLITADVTSAQIDAVVFVLDQMEDDSLSATTTIISSPAYSWIFVYAFDKENVFQDYRGLLYHPVLTDNVILIADNHFLSGVDAEKKLQETYDNTRSAALFEGNVTSYDSSKYPYTSMNLNREGSIVDVRVSYELTS